MGCHFCRPARVVLGKAFAYLPIYFVMGYWVFFIVPPVVRDDTDRGAGRNHVVFVPVLAGVRIFRDSDVVLEPGAGDAVLDIRVHVGTVDVYIGNIVAEVSYSGVLGMVWQVVSLVVRD